MSNSRDPDETAHHELSHLDLHCLQKPIVIAHGCEIGKVPSHLQLMTFLNFLFFKQNKWTFHLNF